MQNPLHDELTPIAGLEDRIVALTAVNDGPHGNRDSARAQLLGALATSTADTIARKRRRVALATALIVTPLILFGVAVVVVGVDISSGFPFGSSAVPTDIGHRAPIFDSVPIAANPSPAANNAPSAKQAPPKTADLAPMPATSTGPTKDTPALATQATPTDCPSFLSVLGVTQLRILGEATCPSEQADILQGPFEELVARDPAPLPSASDGGLASARRAAR